MPLCSGDQLGPYEIVAPLGAGGMGEVYRARDLRLRREVALKILPAEVANDSMRRQRSKKSSARNPDYWRLMYIDVVEFGNKHVAGT